MSAEQLNSVGRPPKYDKDYHPAKYLELAKLGKTKIQCCAEFDICEDTFYAWAKTHDEFSESIKRGRVHVEAWYTDFGMGIAKGEKKNANVTAYIWLTKNCVNWSEKNKVTHGIDDIEFEDDGDDEE